ncbi:unnamed protein product [Cunninghamella echinulata]
MKLTYFFVCFLLLLLNTVSSIPVEPGYLNNTVVTPSSVKPGDKITLTWDYVKKNKNTNFDLYLGHSTGMNQAPVHLLKKNVPISAKKASGILPTNLTKSGPGNIWIIETVVKKGEYVYTLSSNVITVE